MTKKSVHELPAFPCFASSLWPVVDLSAMARRAQRASLPPWVSEPRQDSAKRFESVRIPYMSSVSYFDTAADTDFVAHAREDVPTLLALVDAMAEAMNEIIDWNPNLERASAALDLLDHIGKRR